MVAAKFAIGAVQQKSKRPRRPDPACDEMDADYIHDNVCVDAGRVGAVLGIVQSVRNIADVYYQKARAITAFVFLSKWRTVIARHFYYLFG